LPRTVAHLGERRSHPYSADHQTPPRRRWLPRPAPHLGGREKFRVDQQAPPLRARLRNQTRPPRSHGPPRHHHDHDQATRPNLTIFKHPLEGPLGEVARIDRRGGPAHGTLGRWRPRWWWLARRRPEQRHGDGRQSGNLHDGRAHLRRRERDWAAAIRFVNRLAFDRRWWRRGRYA